MTAVASQPESSMHIHRRPDQLESSISNHMVRNYAEISSARERADDLDENCPLMEWVRTVGNPAPNSLPRETISDLPENVPRIQRVDNLPDPTATSIGYDRVGSQTDKSLQLDSGIQYQLGDFQLRIGKVVATNANSLRGIVLEMEYLPISSVEKSRVIMEEFLDMWQEIVSKRSLHVALMHIEPNFAGYGLADHYTPQHTVVQYATVMTHLLQSNVRN
ncbi:hypothetical protein IFM89_026500 [Coptis chinensis]|uniref:Mediator of RNA polymerase II transcription subunit 20 n=1 Tax=Coptis chinensis TaxID=261450 RepID=A0A835M1S8_9MAGN|nr:hypothetical protein IFM89_026500 [Coptis chinensis]